MGYNTTVVILNDALDSIENDPTFGVRLAKEIRQSSFRPDTPNEVSAGGFVNAAMVVETHSSSDEVTVIVGKNSGRVQTPDEIDRARDAGYERGREDERKKKKERQTRERKRIDELENIVRVGGALLRAERVVLGVPVVDMAVNAVSDEERVLAWWDEYVDCTKAMRDEYKASLLSLIEAIRGEERFRAREAQTDYPRVIVDRIVRARFQEPDGDTSVGRVVELGAEMALVDWWSGPRRRTCDWFPRNALVGIQGDVRTANPRDSECRTESNGDKTIKGA